MIERERERVKTPFWTALFLKSGNLINVWQASTRQADVVGSVTQDVMKEITLRMKN